MYNLRCFVHQYAWGKPGNQSFVARMAQLNSGQTISDQEPYAEFWMGSHCKGMNYVEPSGTALNTFIKSSPSRLAGNKTMTDFPRTASHGDLPFLFKVLSVNKALSIQAHPNKQHAEELHRIRPDLYPDANHKPEMAIALTNFEVLCGFRPYREIRHLISTCPELQSLLGDDICQRVANSVEPADPSPMIRLAFSRLMNQDKALVSNAINQLCQRLHGTKEEQKKDQSESNLVVRLNAEFPGDVGCFSPYFFNHINLEPGEAVFLKANLPHAYLRGDCMECMACSDNVVRAGLTPKHIDVETLLAMLDYSPYEPDELRFQPTKQLHQSCQRWIYEPPVKDFVVERLSVTGPCELAAVDGPSIVAVVDGGHFVATTSDGPAMDMSLGKVAFVQANLLVDIGRVELPAAGRILLFRAYSC